MVKTFNFASVSASNTARDEFNARLAQMRAVCADEYYGFRSLMKQVVCGGKTAVYKKIKDGTVRLGIVIKDEPTLVMKVNEAEEITEYSTKMPELGEYCVHGYISGLNKWDEEAALKCGFRCINEFLLQIS